MYLADLRRHLTDDVVKAIENESTFKVFLVRFWVHNFREYLEFSEREKSICIEEYIKTKLEKDKNWLNNLTAFFTY